MERGPPVQGRAGGGDDEAGKVRPSWGVGCGCLCAGCGCGVCVSEGVSMSDARGGGETEATRFDRVQVPSQNKVPASTRPHPSPTTARRSRQRRKRASGVSPLPSTAAAVSRVVLPSPNGVCGPTGPSKRSPIPTSLASSPPPKLPCVLAYLDTVFLPLRAPTSPPLLYVCPCTLFPLLFSPSFSLLSAHPWHA